jgi:glycosyltransferase involved in cell wall biosynthesis
VPEPAVSILLPFYNAANTIEECLDSIARQTLADYELVAVDDGSSDNGPAIVREYAHDDKRIRLLRPGRIGLVKALNLGLNAGRAPLIARMDADDRMHPRRLAHQLQAFQERPALHLLGTRVRLFPEERIQGGYREYVRWQNRCVEPADIAQNIYVESPFAHPSVMFRKDSVMSLGGYRGNNFPEDYDLWLRMHHAGLTMAKLPEVLLEWRESENRLSRTHPVYACVLRSLAGALPGQGSVAWTGPAVGLLGSRTTYPAARESSDRTWVSPVRVDRHRPPKDWQ